MLRLRCRSCWRLPRRRRWCSSGLGHLDGLDEEALGLAVVELGDPRVIAGGLAIATIPNAPEPRRSQQLVGEVGCEHRDRIAVPEHVEDELAAQARRVVVG